MQTILVYLSLFIHVVISHKILIYNPLMWPSHDKFLNKFADVLVEGGHEVTVLMPPQMDKDLVNTTDMSRKRIIRSPGDPRTQQMMAMSKQGSFRSVDSSSIGYGDVPALIDDDDLLRKLAAEKFDIAISEACLSCGFGLFDLLKIPATISVISNTILDSTSYAIGEPFAELRASTLQTLLAQTSFIFTNANPYLDFPRPTLHKTVMIGGFAVPSDNETKLPNEWDAILNARKHTVLISFGSSSKSIDMPDEYKRGLLNAFALMPDVIFIWKYEDPDSDIASSLPNVHLIAWVPQIPLLNDKRLSLFLTHGGLASTTETAYSGTPAIVVGLEVPLLGDQMRNAQMLARHQGALILHKTDLTNSEILKRTTEEVLNNSRYAENAERLALMLRDQPISPKELLLKHVEFAAKFGRLSNLDPYGRQLTFFQYYLVDILAMLITILMLLIAVVCLVKRCRCRRSPKLKQS